MLKPFHSSLPFPLSSSQEDCISSLASEEIVQNVEINSNEGE